MLSRGTIVDVSESNIILLEFDFLENQDVEYEYNVDEETEFHAIGSIDDLAEGDFVEITFYEDEERLKATLVQLV